MNTVTCNISITLNEEEMELYVDILNQLHYHKKPQEIIRELHSYDCITHKVKKILEAIKIVVNKMSIVEFVVLTQNTESALVLSILEDIK
jgi:hypothetical protein